MEGVLDVQLRARRRPRLDLAGARSSRGHTVTAAHDQRGSWLFFGAWCVGVLVLGLRAPPTPRLAQLGFLVVAGFLLVNKVYSPQYVLWLLPLAVLARPRWRDQLVWQAGEVLYFGAVWWYLGGWTASAPAAVPDRSTGSRSWSGWPPSSTSWRSWCATCCSPGTTRCARTG